LRLTYCVLQQRKLIEDIYFILFTSPDMTRNDFLSVGLINMIELITIIIL